MSVLDLAYHPVTPDRWGDFEKLFGPRGACGGCWCMWWRVKRSVYDAQKGEGNRRIMRAIIESGEVPGLLAYDAGHPVGWCSIAPRETFSVLGRSRILKPVDDRPVWSVVCFFIEKGHRRQGLSVGLLRAAIDYAKENGAEIVEGYPVEPKEASAPDVFVFTGLVEAFRQAGFVEVLRRSPARPIMRCFIADEG